MNGYDRGMRKGTVEYAYREYVNRPEYKNQVSMARTVTQRMEAP